MAAQDMQYNPFTGKLDIAGTSDSMTEAEIQSLCPIDTDDIELPDGTQVTLVRHIPMTADEIEQLTPFNTPDIPPTDRETKVENVLLTAGLYYEDTKEIKWYVGNGAIRLTQRKGYGNTAVNEDYIDAPRAYKGHILFFETLAQGVYIQTVKIKYSGRYKGNGMVAGIDTDTSRNVVQNTDLVDAEWATVSSGEHIIQANNEQGLTLLYIQNSSTEETVQLRITNIEITYQKTI
ncbi:MAG: hypothetical protein KBS40_02295 [Bacteroidales bacterium]|nr:hypothetical protein [Bacteroidales bacterium]